jgi:diguanylate cyclase (GGDEF)-like protein
MTGDTERLPSAELQTVGDELSRLLGVKTLVEDYGPQSAEARAWFAQVRAALSRADRAQAAEFDGMATGIQERSSLATDDPLWIQSLLMVYRAIAHLPASDAGEGGLDSLTRLGKRRTFHADLTRLVDEAQAGRGPITLILADLDQFNRVNYDVTPQVGDEVLQAAGAEVARVALGRGHAYRYGSDEMAVLLPGTGSADGTAIAERLRAAVAQISVPSLGRSLTASIGVATVPEHATDPATLFEKAGRALNAARDAGRNQVKLAD